MAFHRKFREFHTGNTAGIVIARFGIRAGTSVAASFRLYMKTCSLTYSSKNKDLFIYCLF